MDMTPRTRDRASALTWLILWAATPFTVGDALAGALAGADATTARALSSTAWVAWAAVAVAAAVPRSVVLTAIRIAAPAPLAVAVVVAIGHDPSPLALASGTTVAVMTVAPGLAPFYIGGSAYGSELRAPLRLPPALLLGPLPLGWLAVAGGSTAPVVLLADRRWLPAVIATVVGVPIALVAVRAVHGLARRWLVFVPAGVVLHDPYTLADPVLLPRSMIELIGPAPARSDALDLTAGAWGLAIEVRLREPLTLTLARHGFRRRQRGDTGRCSRLIVTPTRPGRVLREADRRGIPLGSDQAAATAPPSTTSPS
ncbi:MAG TPA: hypothetical protein VGA13_02980 [Acidimicrobiales bacterium]